MFFGEEAKAVTEGVLGTLGKTVKDAVSAFKADPTKVAELEASLEQAHLQYEQIALQAVNATMQAEAKSEHWLQWSWRPMFGFTACAVLVNNYVLLPYLKPFGVVVIEIPSEVWIMIMTVLGVAAWTRGARQIEEAKK